VRVVLLYPPPWKLNRKPSAAPAVAKSSGSAVTGEASKAAAVDPARMIKGGEGPPADYREGDLDADFYQTPYGLFALASGLIRAGHPTKVINLSAYPWDDVVDVIEAIDADVFGMSAWTANRRGVGYVADLIRRKKPSATIVVGGPHASPLAREMLMHHAAIDLVCRGESDETLLEILAKKVAGEPLAGIAGTAYREASNGTNTEVKLAPSRPQVANLDALACPQDYFPTHILMTSRGCPWSCTFCGAETSWGRGFRANSIRYVVDAMEAQLARLPVKMIQIKDDTFTTNKKRVLALCKEIQRRGLRFLWSCDTRVDLLSDELLREMRLAGCQRLSLGVESGSQAVLDAIDKKITPDEIIESTALAKRYGIKVRYYMMLGNRGETRETFAETQAFLQRARPHEYVFSCLSVYPGTRDFADAERTWLDRQVFFRETFQELKTPFDCDPDTAAFLNTWFFANKGLQKVHEPDAAEFLEILERIPGHHAALIDVAAAYYKEGNLDGAELYLEKAREAGYPLRGILLNHQAVLAKARGQLERMMDLFSEAAKVDPVHYVLVRNVEKARHWFKSGAYDRKEPLTLEMRHDFQLLERTLQPTLPGTLPADFADWQTAVAQAAQKRAEFIERAPLMLEYLEEGQREPEYVRTPEQEGSGRGFRPRLPVVG
jgi:anaerobic magnesium-protoporphyrin IX monomethyl ester cyclase